MPIGDLLAQISGEPSSAHTSSNLPPKRKADDDLRRPVDKVQRIRPPVANSSRPIVPNRLPTLDTSVAKLKIAPNSRSPSVQTPSSSRPMTPASTDKPKAPPKKGSFAEILARGKAAQATLGQVGKIQHKRIEKRPSKREVEEIKAQKSKNLQKGLERNPPNGKAMKPSQTVQRDGRNGSKDNQSKNSAVVPEKKVKKAATATTGYAGTARPKPGASNTGSRNSSSSRREDSGRYYGSGGGSSRRYAYASEDDDEDMEEEEENYYSDESDMEAGAFEVDEEEEEAARIARREDAEALAQENQHKREKEERRKKLMAMAAKSRR